MVHLEEQSLTFKWLTGILLAILFFLVTSWFAFLNNSIKALENTNAEEDEKITTLETQLPDIKMRLERIETKVDRLLLK